jgi:hypothetical protein
MGAKVALRGLLKNDDCQFSKTKAKSSKKRFRCPYLNFGL